MPNIIEDRIVKMEFDNAKFEKNVKTSLGTIDKLKKAINFDDQSKSIKELQRTANQLTLDDLDASIQNLEKHFSVMGVAGMTVVSELTKSFLNLGKSITKTLMTPFSLAKSGGWSRAMKIKDAKFSIEGLGKSFEELKDDINDAVAGTAYGYDAAAKAASQFAASGIQAGKEVGQMGQALRAVSGVAAQTSSSYEEISNIFTTIASNGKVMTQQLRQLSFRGMNASAVLAKHLGVSEAAVSEMVRQGEIDFATFAQAMDEAFGEHATKANETFQGALDNTKAALSRIGANFADPYIDASRDVLNATRIILNGLNSATGAWDGYSDVLSKVKITSSGQVKELESQTTMLDILYNEFGGLTVRVDESTKSMMRQYDKLKGLKNLTEDQAKQLKVLKRNLKDAFTVTWDNNSDGSAIETLRLLEYRVKNNMKLSSSEQMLYKNLKSAANETSYYLTEVGKKALDRLDKLDAIKNKTKEELDEMERLRGIVADNMIWNSGGFLRLSETVGEAIKATRDKIVGFLEQPGIIVSLNNIIDGINAFAQNITGFARPIINAWRQIFPKNEIDAMVIATNRFREFMQSLRLSEEYADDVESAFRGIFSALSILKTVAGDVFNLFKTVGTPIFKAFVKVLGWVGERIVDLEWRFNQLRAGIKYVVDFFKITTKSFSGFGKAFNGFANVVGSVAKTLSFIAVVLGSVLVGGIVVAVAAFAKLASAVGGVLEFLAPVGEALLNLAIVLGGTFIRVLSAVAKPIVAFAKGTGLLNQNVDETGKESVPILLQLVGVLGQLAVAARDLVVNGLNFLSDAFTHIWSKDFWVGVLENIKTKVVELRDAIVDLPNKVGGPVGGLLSLIIGGAQQLGNAIKGFFDSIGRGSVVLAKGKDAAHEISEEGGGLLDKLKEFMGAIKNSAAVKAFGDALGSMADAFAKLAENITPAKVFAVAFAVVLGVLAKAIYDVMEGFASMTTEAGGMFKSIGGFFKQLTSNIKPVQKGITVFKELAVSVAILTASIYVLSEIDEQKIYKALGAMGALALGIAAFSGIMTAISIQGTEFSSATLKSMTGSFLAATASLLIISFAITKVAEANWHYNDALLQKVLLCLGTFATIMATLVIMSKAAGEQEIKSCGVTVLAVAGALYIVARVFEKLEELDPLKMLKVFLGLLPVIAAIGLVGLGMSKVRFGSAIGMLAVLATLKLTMPLIESLKGFDLRPIIKVIQDYLAFFTQIVLIGAFIQFINGKGLFSEFEEFGAGLFKISVAIGMLSAIALWLGHMDDTILQAGINKLKQLGYLILALEAFSILCGGNFKDFGVGLILVSSAMVIMVGIVALLAMMDYNALDKGLKALGALTACIVALEICSKLAEKIKMSSFIGILLTLGALTAAVVMLSNIEWVHLQRSVLALLSCLLVLGIAFRMIGNGFKDFKDTNKAIGSLLVLVGSIVALGWALDLVSKNNWNNTLAAGAAMSACLLFFAKAFSTIQKSIRSLQWKTMQGALWEMAILIGAVAAFGYALSIVAAQPWQGILSGGLAMCACLEAFAKAFAIIQDSLREFQMKTMLPNLLALSVLIGAVLAIGGALAIAAMQPWPSLLAAGAAMCACIFTLAQGFKIVMGSIKGVSDPKKWIGSLAVLGTLALSCVVIGGALAIAAMQPWDNLLAAGAAMSMCLLTVAESFKLIISSMREVKLSEAISSLGIMAALAGLCVAIGFGLSLIATEDWSSLLAAGAAMSMCLLAFTASFKLIASSTKDLGDVLQLIAPMLLLCGAVWVLGDAMAKLAKYDWKSIAAAGASMSIGILAFSGALKILSTIPIEAAVQGALGFVTFIGILVAALAGLKLIAEGIFGAEDGIEAIGELFRGLGQWLGDFISGIGEGATSGLGTIGDNIAAFGEAMKPFMDNVAEWDSNGAIEAGKAFFEMLVAMAGYQIAEGMANIFSFFTGAGDLETLGDKLASFGKAMVAFRDEVKYLTKADIEQIRLASQAANVVMQMAEKVPRDGGWVDQIMGSNDLDDFGDKLKSFGENLVKFCEATVDLDTTGVEKAKIAMDMITEFAREIPNSGGLLAKLVGDNDLDDFGAMLPDFGSDLKQFAANIDGISTDGVENARIVAGMVVEFARSIPNDGGLLGKIMGNNNLGDFGSQLPTFGVNLRSFANKIDGISTDSVEDCKTVMDMIIEFARAIPNQTSGSFLGWLTGSNDLGTFASALPTLGQGLADFSGKVKDINNDKVTVASTGILEIALATQRLEGADINKLKTFAAGLPTAGENYSKFIKNISSVGGGIDTKRILDFKDNMEIIDKMAQTLSDSSVSKLENYTKGLANISTTGLSFVSEETISNFKASMDSAMTDISSRQQTFMKSGESHLTQYAAGIESAKDQVVAKIKMVFGKIVEVFTSIDFVKKGKDAAGDFTKGFSATEVINNAKKAATKFGSSVTNGFVKGIRDNLDKAKKAGKELADAALYKGTDKEIDDPIIGGVPMSSVAIKFGRSVSAGFAYGIQDSSALAVKEAIKLGESSLDGIDKAIDDPKWHGINVSKKAMAFGESVSGGFAFGIEALQSGVQKASEILGQYGLSGLIDTAGASEIIGKLTGDNFIGGLLDTINSIKRKDKGAVDEFFKGLFGDEVDKIMKSAGGDVGKGVGDLAKSKGGSGGSGGKSGAKWTHKDAEKVLAMLSKIFPTIQVGFDAFNKKLLDNGKATILYLAKSVKDNVLANGIIAMGETAVKEVNKAANAIYKDIYKKQMAKLKAKAKSEGKKFDKDKAKTDIRAKATKKAAKEILKEYEAEYNELKTKLHKMVKDKSLEKTILSMPSFTATFLKNYDKKLDKSLSKNIDHLAKTLGNTAEAATKAKDAYRSLGWELYKKSDEYKENSKQLRQNAKEMEKLQAKAKKLGKELNKSGLSAEKKQKLSAKLEDVTKQYIELEKQNKSISKEMETGPVAMVTELSAGVKEALKDFTALTNIDFSKTVSGLKKISDVIGKISGSFDASNASMSKFTKSSNQLVSKYDILNNSFDTGIKLLEKFTKTGKAETKALLERATGQLDAYEEFQSSIEKLRSTNLASSVIDELEDSGPGALNYIRGFLDMTSDEIASYNEKVAKKEQYEGNRLQRSMDRQLKQYQTWVSQIEELAGNGLSDGIKQKLIDAGVGQAAFVNALTNMKDGGLAKVEEYYKKSIATATEYKNQFVISAAKTLASSASDEVTSVFDPLKNLRSWVSGNSEFNKAIENLRKKFASAFSIDESQFTDAMLQIIETVKASGMEDTQLLDWLNSASMADFKAYANEYADAISIIKDADETLRDYATGTVKDVTNYKRYNGYLDWTKQIIKEATDYGDLDVAKQYQLLYDQLSEMGYEDGIAFGQSFYNASSENKKLLLSALEEQDSFNKAMYGRQYLKNKEDAMTWAQDMATLVGKVPLEVLQDVQEAGPGDRGLLDYILSFADDEEALKDFNTNLEKTKKATEEATRTVLDAMALTTDADIQEWVTKVTDSKEVKGASQVIEKTTSSATKAGLKGVKKEATKQSKAAVSSVEKTFTSETTITTVTESVNTFGSTIIKTLKKYLNKSKGTTMGKNVGNGIVSGLKSTMSSLTKTCNAIVSTVKSMAASCEAAAERARAAMASMQSVSASLNTSYTSQQASNTGAAVGEGVASGLKSSTSKVSEAAHKVARNIVEELRSNLKVNSPSKVTMEIGKYVVEGFAIGMEDNLHLLNKPVDDFTNIVTSIADSLDTEDLSEPVIRPTLDLSDVTAKARELNSIIQSSVDDVKVSADGTEGTKKESGNMTFIQNNYSPKALDRLELYRQTRNQFANAKGLVMT